MVASSRGDRVLLETTWNRRPRIPESRSRCRDEFVDDPLGDADRVGVRQPEDEVFEAGVDGVADRVAGDVGLVVGDR